MITEHTETCISRRTTFPIQSGANRFRMGTDQVRAILCDGRISLLMTIFMLGVLEDALVFGQTATALWSYRPKGGKSTTGFES